jgi:hypothetical protein
MWKSVAIQPQDFFVLDKNDLFGHRHEDDPLAGRKRSPQFKITRARRNGEDNTGSDKIFLGRDKNQHFHALPPVITLFLSRPTLFAAFCHCFTSTLALLRTIFNRFPSVIDGFSVDASRTMPSISHMLCVLIVTQLFVPTALIISVDLELVHFMRTIVI